MTGTKPGVIRTESSVRINRPIGHVFEFVSDCRNEPQWHGDVVEAGPLTEGPIGVGARQRWILRGMGRFEMTMEVRRLEPNRLVQLEAEAPARGMRPTITYRLEPDRSATRFTRGVDAELTGVAKALRGLVHLLLPRRNRRFAESLKRVLERAPGGGR